MPNYTKIQKLAITEYIKTLIEMRNIQNGLLYEIVLNLTPIIPESVEIDASHELIMRFPNTIAFTCPESRNRIFNMTETQIKTYASKEIFKIIDNNLNDFSEMFNLFELLIIDPMTAPQMIIEAIRSHSIQEKDVIRSIITNGLLLVDNYDAFLYPTEYQYSISSPVQAMQYVGFNDDAITTWIVNATEIVDTVRNTYQVVNTISMELRTASNTYRLVKDHYIVKIGATTFMIMAKETFETLFEMND